MAERVVGALCSESDPFGGDCEVWSTLLRLPADWSS